MIRHVLAVLLWSASCTRGAVDAVDGQAHVPDAKITVVSDGPLDFSVAPDAEFPPTFSYDMNADGINDTNLTLETCQVAPHQLCLRVESNFLPTSEVALGPNAISPNSTSETILAGSRIEPIGDHDGDSIDEVAVLFLRKRANHDQPVLAVINPATQKVVASAASPISLERFHAYPLAAYSVALNSNDRKKVPLLAPGYGDSSQGSNWGYACMYRPGTIGAKCGKDFADLDTMVDGNWFRELGGYLQDLDGDGWDDLNLIYHRLVIAISGRTMKRISLLTYDVAGSTNPHAPKFFHSGRNYGTHYPFVSSDAALKTLIVGGSPVGSFDNPYCNVSRFVAVLESQPGSPETRRLSWSTYMGFHSHIFSEFDDTYQGDPEQVLARAADFQNGCIHRFGNSTSRIDDIHSVIFNLFETEAPIDQCFIDQYQLYLDPSWTAEKVAAWETCHRQNLRSRGFWRMVALRTADGSSVTGSLHTYVWGYTHRLMPGDETVYLVEFLPDETRFDLTDVDVSRMHVLTLKNGLWVDHGRFPVVGRPKINLLEGTFNIGLGHPVDRVAELHLRDVDGDGLDDVQLQSGAWVGYSATDTQFVVKYSP